MFKSTPSNLKLCCLLLSLMVICTIQIKAQVGKPQSDVNHVRDSFDFKPNKQRSRNIAFEDGKTSAINEVDDRVIDSLFHLDKNYDFEFRFWSRYLSMNFNNVFIMRLSNNAWTARYFDLNESHGNPKKFTERKVEQSKVDQLWTRLVENKVLTLPDMRDLDKSMVSYKIDTATLQLYGRRTDMTDGVLYGFELLTPTRKRHYNYGNPGSYLKNYSHIQELALAQLNVMLIQKFLGKPY